MDIERAQIEVLFSKIPPEIILNKFILSSDKVDTLKGLKPTIIQYLLEVLPGYSDDERYQVYELFLQQNKECMEQGHRSSIFNCVRKFSDRVLVEYDYIPYCRYEHLLRWRMLSLKLEQDFFVTAYLAQRDVESARTRTNFTWEPIIKTDNFRLHNMLQHGLAENHFHLKGSAPCYQLSWISLMNRVSNREKEFKAAGMLNNKLNRETWYEENIAKDSLRNLMVKAALIRKFLFEYTFRQGNKEKNEQLEKKLKERLRKSSEELMLEYHEIDGELESLRYENINVHYRDIKIHTVDYMIDPRHLTADNNNYKLLLYGERRFMYECFKKLFEKRSDNDFIGYEELFYLYLSIKNRFRAEIVQVNNRVGFKNFSEYQDRKMKFLHKEPLLMQAVNYMAVKATEEGQKITQLEARIAPEKTLTETRNSILSIDKDISQIGNGLIRDDVGEFLCRLKDKDRVQGKDYPCFYVIHAIKGIDKYGQRVLSKKAREILEIRDISKRIEAKRMAWQLMFLRERRFDVARRVYGIDAASNEIGCRPEVFAQAFRLLKQHTVSKQFDTIKYLMDNASNREVLSIPPLKITYHAGEDFLDITDGLRAIDEAVEYMNLSHGERIGHALALGVDVKEWYRSKNNTIVLYKQDYLDNVCWLLNKVDLWKIPVEHSSYQLLQREYDMTYKEVYQIDKNSSDYCSYEEYYNAWELRGDNPICYSKGEYEQRLGISFWERCDVNDLLVDGYAKRKNSRIARLYYHYHYDYDVRERGNITISKKVEEDYIELIRSVQAEMQQRLKHKGIGIETNPSSNYSIGTFKRYDQHPISKFYNLGLTCDTEEIKKCPQLFISINTDDQGVFDTYLENEYALLGLAMEKARGADNRLLYNQEMIYDWLNRIRLMGLQQSFNISNNEIRR